MADLNGHTKEYFDSLKVPTLEEIEVIAKKQEEKEKEVAKKYLGPEPTNEEREKAAGTIQVFYLSF